MTKISIPKALFSSLFRRIPLFFIFLLIYIAPVFSQTTDNFILCRSDNNTLDETLGNFRDGFWRTIQGYGEFVDSTSHVHPIINKIAFGTNVFRFYEYNNPGPGFTLEHVFNVYNYNVFAGNDTTICDSGGSIQLNGSDPLKVNPSYSGTWTVISGTGVFANNTQYNTTVSGMTVGAVNTYRWRFNKDLPGCGGPAQRQDDINITVNPRPTAAISGTTDICAGQSATLTVNLTGTAPWSITYTDGVTPVTINNINATPHSFSVTPNTSRTYTLAAASDSKCASTAADLSGSADITVNPLPTAVISGTNTICRGLNTNLTVTFTGTAPWSITYSDGITPTTINNINTNPYTFPVSPATSKTYTLTAASDSKCVSTAAELSGSAVITVNPRPTVAMSGTNTICVGQSTSLTLNLTGTGPWNVTYTDGIAPVTINNINLSPHAFSVSPASTKTYVLTSASDAKCSSIAADLTGNAIVTVNPRPTAVLSGTTTICNGQSATITATLTGSAPWSITYTDGGAPVTINNILTNIYSFTVSPAATKTYTLTAASDSKCASIAADLTGSAVVTVNPRPTAIISGTTTICNGQSATLTANFTGTAPWSLTYTDGVTPTTINNINANPYTFTVSPSSTKTYTLSAVSDSKCASIAADLSGSATINVDARPTVALSGTTTICNGQSTLLVANLTGVAPWSITYTDGFAPVTINNINTNPYTFSVSPVATKTYNVTDANDNNCTSFAPDLSGSPIVTVNPRPTAVLSGTNTICNGQSSTLTVTLTGTGPWSITYTDGVAPVTINNINLSPHKFNVSPSSTKTYTLTATSDSKCAAIAADLSSNAVVTVNPRPSGTISGTNTICNGQSATLSVALTGTAPWSITYTDGATPVTINNINASPHTFTVSPSSTSTYTLTSVSDTKCSSIAADLSGNAVITVNPRPTVALSGTTTICNGQQATLTVNLTGSAPWNITYTDGITPVTINNINASPYTFNITPTTSKTYSLTAANDSKCTSIAADLSGSAVITVNPRPTAVLSGTTTICNGQSATLTVNFTGTAPWGITYTDGITPVTINNINANPYTFTVSPSSTKTYTLSAVSDIKCASIGADLTGSATITVDARPTAVLGGTTTICNGQSATLTINFTGVAPWNITYTDGVATISVNNINSNPYSFPVSPNATKTFSLTALSDSKCTAMAADISGTPLVTVAPRPTAALSGTNTICNGQSATLTVNLTGSAPWSITYTDGVTPVTINNINLSPHTFTVSPSSAKTYSLTAASDSRCTAIAADLSGNAAITVNPRPTAVLNGTNTICSGQSAMLSVALTGTGPWSITYTDGTTPTTIGGIAASPFTFPVSPVATSTFTLSSVSDSKCSSIAADLSGNAVIAVNPRPTAVISGTTSICNGQSTPISITLTGTAPWSVTYTDGVTPVTVNNINASPYTFNVSPASNTTYTVTAASDSKCSAIAADLSGNAIVSVNPRPTAVLSGTTTICDGQSANLSVVFTGTAPWSITYSDGITPATINNINANPYTLNVAPTTTQTYTLTSVTDSKCSTIPGDINGSAIVTVNERPTATLSGSASICKGQTATLSLVLTGTGPWNVTYTDGTVPVTINGIAASNYIFTVAPNSTKTYTLVSVSDSKCAASMADLSGNAIVTIIERPTAVISGTNTICIGQSATLTATLTGSSPWSITYTDGTTPVTINNIITSTYTFLVTPTSTKTYTLSAVNDSKCSSLPADLTGSAVVTVTPRPTAILSGSSTICYGQSATLTLNLTGSGPWNVTYTDGITPVSMVNINVTPYTFTVSPSSTRTYTITALNDSRCAAIGTDLSGSATITVNSRPTGVISGTSTICNGQSTTLTINLTGSAPWNVTYTDGVTPVTIPNINASPYTFTVSPNTTSTYTLTALNDNKCSSQPSDLTGSAVVTVNPRPTAVFAGSNTCVGQSGTLSLTFTGSAPWSVTYTDGITPVTVNNINANPYVITVFPVTTTTYTLTSLSDSKCTALPSDYNSNATVAVNTRLTADISGTTTICNGQPATLTVDFTGSCPWSFTYTDGTTPATINNINTNTYTFQVTPSSTRTYTLLAASDTKCASVPLDLTGSATVTVNPRPTATISGSSTICNGQSTTLTITLSGSSPWNVTYTDGTVPVTINNILSSPYTFTVAPGSTKTYTLLAASDTKCSSAPADLTGSAVVTVYPHPTVALSGTTSICFGQSATLSLSLTGTSPWNVTYTDGAVPVTINNINVSPYTFAVSPTITKTYTVTAANDSKCTSLAGDISGSALVTVNTRPTAVLSGTATICNGQSATFTANLTGAAPWSITYTDGVTPMTINNINASPYTFTVAPSSSKTYTLSTVSDSKCSALAGDISGSAVVTVNPRPTAVISGTTAICSGQSATITLNLTGTAPWNITYTDGVTPVTINNINASPYIFTVSPTTTQTYTVTALSDSKCNAVAGDMSGSAIITVNPRPTGVLSGSTTICTGQSATLTLTLTGSAPWDVIYTDGTTPVTVTNINTNVYTFTVSPGSNKTYTVTSVTDSKCAALPSDISGSAAITVNPRPTAILSGTNTICNGQLSPLTLTLTGTAPWSVTYTDGITPVTINNILTSTYTFNVSPSSTKTYTLSSVTDSKCSALPADMNGSAVITVNPRPTVALSGTNSICYGQSATLTLNLTGTAPWSVTYTDGTTPVTLTVNASPYTFTVSPNTTTTYTLTTANDSKCSSVAADLTGSAVVTVNPHPTVALSGTTTICEAQSATLTLNLTGTAPWSVTYTDGVAPATINNINASPYNFTVTPGTTKTYTLVAANDNKCTSLAADLTGNAVVTVNTRPTAVLNGSTTICNGQSAALSVALTGTAPWSITYTDGITPVTINNINTSPYTFNVSPTTTKTFVLTAVNDSKCNATAGDMSGSAIVNVNARPTAVLGGTTTICDGQSATLTLTLTGSAPWNVTYTDGTTPVTVNNINTNTYTFTISPTSTKTYTLTSLSDSKCASLPGDLTSNAIVTVNPRPTAVISGTTTICNGQSATLTLTLTGTAPWSVTYTDGTAPVTINGILTSTHTFTVTPASNKTYTLTSVSDSKCAALATDLSGSATVTVNPRPAAALSGSNTICYGQSATLTLTLTGTAPWSGTYTDGTTPVTINNINASPYTFTVSPNVTKTYSLTAVNDSKCTSLLTDLSGTATINVNPRPTAALSGTATICKGQSATLTANLTGTGPWNLTYTDGITPVTINNINASPYTFAVSPNTNTTYTVTAVNDSKCTSLPADISGSAVVTVNTRPTAVISGTTTILNGQSATITLTLTGSAPWNVVYTDGTTPTTINNINTSTYTFTVTPSTTTTYTLMAVNDAKCTAIPADISGNAIVNVNPRPTALISGTTTLCNGQSANVSINFTGTGPWNVAYTDGATPVTVNGILANPYIFPVSPTTGKTYTLTALSDAKGSAQVGDLSGSAVITVNPRPTANISGSTTICVGQPATVTINFTGTAPWNVTYTDGVLPVTVNNINTSSYSFVVSPAVNKTYTVTALSDSKCTAQAGDLTGSAAITVNPRPTVALSGNTTICNGQSATLTLALTGSAPWNVTLTDGTTPVSINNINASPHTYAVTPSSNKTYTIAGASDLVCTSLGTDLSGSAAITVNPRPTALISGSTTICNGQSATLTLNLSGTGPWDVTYTDGTASTTIPGINASNYTFTVSPTSTKTYTVTALNDSKCTALATDLSGSAVINVNTRPTAVISGNALLCNGQSATVTLNLTGTAPWNVTYTDGITPVTIPNVNVSPYTFTVTPNANKTYTVSALSDAKCSAIPADLTGSAAINVNPRPTVALTGNTTICNGQSATLTLNLTGTGPWSVTYTDGTTPTTVSINASPYTFIVTPASTTTYTVTAASDSKCTASPADLTSNATVTVNTRPTAVISGTTTICNGSSANLTVTLTGTAPWNITYTDGAAPVTVNGINTNTYTFPVSPSTNTTYTLTAVSDSKCAAIAADLTGSAVVTVNPRPTSVIGNNASICSEDSATISIALTGAGPWNITYSNGTPVSVSTAVSPYTFKVSPAATKTYTVTALSDSRCPALPADMTGSATITIKPLPQTFAVTGGGSYCEGGAGIPIGLSNSTVGISYELYLNNGATGQTVAGSGAAITFGNQTVPGVYLIKGTSTINACSDTMIGSATITKNLLPVDAQIITGTASVCPGSSHVYSIPAVTNATTYTWTLPANTSITAGGGTNSITVLYAPNAVSGNITARGTNLCGNGAASTFAVTVNPLPGTAIALVGETTVCQGEKNVIYSVAPIANATTYTWTVPSGATIVSGQGTSQIIVDYAANASSGNITVKGNNACGSGALFTQAITVVQTPQLTLNAPSNELTCSANTAVVSATSTTAGTSFSWIAINGGNITAGAATASATVNAPGGYIVTVTEPVNSCTNSDTVSVTSNVQAPQNVNIVSSNLGVIDCDITKDTLTASTTSAFAVGYLWTATMGGNITSGANTAKAVVDKGGVYEVKVTNLATGCFTVKSIAVAEQKNLPNISVVDPETERLNCTATTVTLTGSSTTSGVTYSWSGPGIVSGGNTPTPVVNASGIYILTVTAPNGCKSVAPVNVSVDNTLPTIWVDTNPSPLTCSATSVSLYGYSTTAGATLLWTGTGIVSGATTETPVVNQPGVFTLTAKHPSSGCTITRTVTVTQNITTPTVTFPVVPSTITCSVTNVTIQSGTNAVSPTYLWSTLDGTIVAGAATANVVVSKAGNYALRIIDTNNGCQNTATIAVSSDLAVPNAQITPPGTLTCTQTTLVLNGSSTTVPNSVLWTTTDGTITAGSTSFTPTISKIGTYVMTVTNTSNGCKTSVNALVTENKVKPVISMDKNPPVLNCSATKVQLNGTAPGAISLLWTGPAGAAITNPASPTPLVDKAGRYYLTATGANGCIAKDSTDVTSNTTKPANIAINAPGTVTCTTPVIQLTGSSTTPLATFAWSATVGGNIVSPSNTDIISVDAAGTYKMVVTHPVSFCKDSTTVVVNQNILTPVITFPSVPSTITCTATTSTLNSTVAPVNSALVWSGPGTISNTAITNPVVNAAGTYTLVATHPVSGCTTTRTLVVPEDKVLPVVNIAAPATLTCTQPSVTLDGSTSVGSYTASWTTVGGAFSGPTNVLDVVVTKAATYTLTVTNTANGCSASKTVTVTENVAVPDIQIDPNPAKLTCSVTQVQLSGFSTTPSTSLLWTGPGNITNPTSQTPTVDAIGTYTLTVTSSVNGCKSTGTVAVTENKTTPPVPTILVPAVMTCNITSVTLEVSPQLTNVDYLWSTTGTGHITNEATPIATVDAIGTYKVIVTERTSGCTNQNTVVVTENKALPAAVITGTPYVISCTQPTLELNGSTSTGINPVWTASQGGHIVSGANTFKPIIDAAGTYTLTVTSATTDCKHSTNVAVTTSLDLPTLTVDAFPPMLTCSVTSVTLSGQPTEAGTTFTWTASPGNIVSGGTTYNPVVNQPGNYILTVTKTATGCKSTAAIEVKEDKTAPAVVIATPDKFTCAVNQVQLSATSTNLNVSYAWSTVGTGSIKPGFNNVANPIVLTPGTYTVTVTDLSNQCNTVKNAIVTIDTISPNITVDKTPAQLTCSVSQVVLSGNSLTTNATFLWTTTGAGNIANANTRNPRVDAIGYYKLTVTNPLNGCTRKDSVLVTNNLTAPNIWVNITPDTLNCAVDSVKLQGNSATPNVTYSWSGAGYISNAGVKEPYVNTPGTYHLTVTSSVNGCTSTLPVNVVENTTIPGAPVVNGASACYGAAASSLTATGNQIKWYTDATLTPSVLVQTGNTFVPASVTAIGTYNFFVTQTDKNSKCEGPATQVAYSVVPLPAVPVTVDNSVCQGSPNTPLQATESNIKWYGTIGGALLAGGSQYTPPAAVSAPGTYTYYATQTDANGCESLTKTANLVIHPIPAKPTVDKLTAGVCEGMPNTSFLASGNNIKWYASASLPAPVKVGSSFTPLETVPGTYNYYVTQTSIFNCVSPYETVTYTISPLPQKFNVTGGGVYCANLAGLPVGLSGSEPGVSYQLVLNGTTIITSMNGTGAALNFGDQKTPGNYTVTATSGANCSTQMNGGVTIATTAIPDNAGLVAGQTSVCQSTSSITYTVSPVANATSYTWSIPAGANIIAGLNSNSITIDYSSTAVSGTVNVYGLNACGSGLTSPDLLVVVSPLPGAVSNIKFANNDVICLGSENVPYEIDPIPYATEYEWMLPAGASIQYGANTRSIKVRFALNAATGSQFIKVRGKNPCGYSAWSALYNINVNPNPVSDAGIDQNICSNNTTLQANAAPIGGSGIWNIIKGAVTFNNNSQNNTTITTVAQGDNVLTWTTTLNGCKAVDTVKIVNNTLYVEAGQNMPICNPNVTMQGSSLPSGTSGIWTVASGNATFSAASQPNTTASNFGYGDNKLYWTITKNGCSSRDSLIVTNYRPTTPDAGGDRTICYDYTTLSGNTPVYGSGQWAIFSGSATFANQYSPVTPISKVAKGKNVLVWTITNQICSLSDTVVITNNAIDVNAGYDQVVCENRTTMDASQPPVGAIGQWSILLGSASFLDNKAYNTKISGLVNGPNKLIWSIIRGICINTDTVTIISNEPTTPNAGADQFLASNSTTLAGNLPTVGSGKWSIISGAASFTNDTLGNTAVTNLNPGINILRWSITYKGCTVYDDVSVTNGTIEQVDAGQNQVLCTNETKLEASKPQYGFGIWTVQKGSANFEANDTYNTKVTNLAPGTNILRWTVIVSGIPFYDTVIIVNNKPTRAVVGPSQVLCGDSSMLTGNLPVYGTGKWTLDGGSAVIDNINNPNSKVTKLGSGDNLFRWTITQGTCESYALLKITNDIPTTADAGMDQTLCEDKTILMPNAPVVGVGEWSVVGGSGKFLNNEVSGLAQGVNTLRWTIRKNLCLSYDDVKITSYKPTTASAGFNTVVCVDSLIMSANKANAGFGEVGRWAIMNGSGVIVDSTLNTTLVKRIATGKNILRWTITNHGCISVSEVEVNYAYIQSLAGTDVATCDNHVVLNANNPGIGTGEWSVVGGSGTAVFVSSTSPNTEVRNLDQGKNVLRWSIRNFSCISNSEVTITNNAPSEAFAGGDEAICASSYTLDARPPIIGKGAWSVLSGSGRFIDTTAYNTRVNNVGAGSNTYRWTVTNVNCTSTDEVVISNNSPLNTNAGVNQTICADSATLSARYPLVGTGIWSITRGGGLFKDALNPYTKINKLSPDTNILRWTVTNKNCVDYKEVKITNNLPTTASAGADMTICSDYVILDGNNPALGTGEWSVISGSGKFTDKTRYNTLVQNLTRGTNVLRWKISKYGCSTFDDVIIVDDLPTQPDAGTNIAVCDNFSPLNANKPAIGKGFWSVVSGKGTFLDSTKYNTTVFGLGQGSNILKWTTTNNRCSVFDVVEVKNNLTNVYAGPDQTVFENHSQLIGNEPPRGTGTWTLEAGAGSILTPNKFESPVTGLAEGSNTFMWSVDIDGCKSTDRVVVFYYKYPTASFSVNNTDGCPPYTAKFTKTTIEKYPFKWDFGYADSTSVAENPTFTYPVPGTYTAKLTVTAPDGKEVTKTKVITVHELPKVRFEIIPASVYIPGESLRCFNYTEGATRFLWDFGDGITSESLNADHAYTDSGFYNIKLKAWNEFECTDSLVITNGVHVMEKSRLRFPTAFTPNVNGSSNGRYNRTDFSNDVFYPIVLMGDLREYKMEIFNRWGVLLFESKDINVGWDGYYKGKLLMQDVYIYRISGVYNDGKKFSTIGDVLLMRR